MEVRVKVTIQLISEKKANVRCLCEERSDVTIHSGCLREERSVVTIPAPLNVFVSLLKAGVTIPVGLASTKIPIYEL